MAGSPPSDSTVRGPRLRSEAGVRGSLGSRRPHRRACLTLRGADPALRVEVTCVSIFTVTANSGSASEASLTPPRPQTLSPVRGCEAVLYGHLRGKVYGSLVLTSCWFSLCLHFQET